MATNFRSESVDALYPATGAVSSGDCILQGGIVMVLKYDGVNGENVPAWTGGRFDVTKVSGTTKFAWTVGKKIYYAATNSFTVVATSNTYAGVAYSTAAKGDVTGTIILGVGERVG